MPDNLTPETQAAVEQLLFKGEKIAAIKAYREATRCGLADAKAAVEAIEATLRATAPSRFTAPPARSGCLGMVVLGLVTLAAGVAWVLSR